MLPNASPNSLQAIGNRAPDGVHSLIAAHDWSSSPLGATAAWPQSLRTTLGLMRDSPHAMCLAWGPELIFLYNDSYAPILGLRHPAAMGLPMREVWADVWPKIEPLVRRAQSGESFHFEDFHLLMQRDGDPEDTWWSFSYSPARDDAGTPVGMLCVTNETTQKVLAERRHAADYERLRGMVDQAPGFMAVLSGPELKFEFANAAFERVTGRNDYVGKTVREALPDLEGQGLFEQLDHVFATGKRFIASSTPVRMRRGRRTEAEEFILNFLYEPIVGVHGEVTGIFIEGNDVTAAYRAQEALRESEERNRRIVEGVKDHAIFVADTHGVIVDWPPGAAAIFGWSAEQIIGQNAEVLFTPEDRAAGVPAMELCKAREAGCAADERWHIRRDGTRFFANGSVRPLHDAAGEVAGFIKIARDETKRRATEQALRASEAEHRRAEMALRKLNATLEERVIERTRERNLLAKIVETTDAFIQVVDLDYRFLAINKANADEFERVFGVRPNVGDNILDLLAGQPEQQSEVRAQWSRALSGEEFTIIEAFGETQRIRQHYELKFNTLFDAHGERIGAYQFAYNVTDRLRDQARLEENEARLRTLFETSYQLQGWLALDGKVLDANATSLAVIAAQLEDVLGKPFWETPWFTGTPGMPEVARGWIETAARGEVAHQEVSLNVSSGLRFYDFSLRPIRDANGVVFWIVPEAMDITDRRLAEEALRQSQKMEAMGQLTGGVAHDFNNLLTPIIGALDMLMRRKLGNERERRMIDGALQSADRAKTLVQRLLAFARRQPLQPVAVDLAALIDSMAALIGSTLGPNINVRVELAARLPPANADPNQLEMAILNLGVNARDAMPDGGTLTIAATRESVRFGHRTALKPGHYVKLSVADTGIGMDAATRARAVEPFFSTKGVGKGTGLGLSMVHGLAAQLGGGLTIASTPGRGTTVDLWLPISLGPIPGDEIVRSAIPHDARGRALLVDDEELVRMSTADMLTDLGYEVVEADSAEEALRLVRSGADVDLLVTDHLMPGMSGAELAAQLRKQIPALPVLIVSGYAELDGIAPDLARLTKPFRNCELADSLNHLLQPGE